MGQKYVVELYFLRDLFMGKGLHMNLENAIFGAAQKDQKIFKGIYAKYTQINKTFLSPLIIIVRYHEPQNYCWLCKFFQLWCFRGAV